MEGRERKVVTAMEIHVGGGIEEIRDGDNGSHRNGSAVNQRSVGTCVQMRQMHRF